jgi:hypothetical protein
MNQGGKITERKIELTDVVQSLVVDGHQLNGFGPSFTSSSKQLAQTSAILRIASLSASFLVAPRPTMGMV